MKPISIIFGLKSVLRRKQKNFFGILAIALGVSLITGISITDQSLSEGFGVFFTFSLGEVDGTVSYSNGFMNESIAESIGTELESLGNITAHALELSIPVTTSTLEGQINIQSVLKGIDKNDNPNIFGNLVRTESDYLKITDLGVNEVYIGKELADDLGVKVGDKFNYSLSFGPIQIEKELSIKNIVINEQRSAMGANQAIFMELEALQSVIGPVLQTIGFPVTHPVTVIYLTFSDEVISVDDGELLATQMKKSLENLPDVSLLGGIEKFNLGTDRITIKEFGKSLADALGMLLSIFGSILIIAGLILIVNIQLMTVENQEKQIGIRRAVGTKNYQVILSSLTEFVIIGLVGGLVGIFGGIIFGAILIQAFGISFGFDGSLIPVSVPASILSTAFMMGFLIAILSGLYPAIKASRINVIEVLRGLEVKEFKIKEGSGIWGFIFGLLLTVLGLLSVMGLSKSPFDFPGAYLNVSDAESIYISTTFLLVGLLVLLSYFVSRNMILSITGLSLIIYPVFQLFVIFNEIKEGNGGINYILVLALSLIGGSILLVSLNLDKIANFSEKIFSIFFSAISMISFRQMASQKTRSTLTFAIFAFILTLNIMLASWSYSDRYGAERRVNILAGNSDVLIISSQPLGSNLTGKYIQGLEAKFDSITHASAFPHSGPTDLYLHNNGSIVANQTSKFVLDIFAVNNETMIHNNNLEFSFSLLPEKLNDTGYSFPTQYIDGLELDDKNSPLDAFSETNLEENNNAWKFFSSGMTVVNKTSGKEIPTIITSYIAEFDIGTQQISYLKDVMDPVWLPLKNGSFIEFVVIAISSSNPLFDSVVLGIQAGTAILSTGAFVHEKWARELAAFNPSPQLNYLDQSNYFLISTPNNVKSEENDQLANDIETWSNGLGTDSFRVQQGKLFGFLATTVYFIYETSFDGEFKIFQFMQYFTTLGFLFGVISLLVVSVRSVQERKREIGMMRSIGVKRHEVVVALILELSVMGIIGLLIGLLNGNLLAYGLVRINGAGFTNFLIPWDNILIYTLLTIGSALFASIIPGRVASMIPPSDALRYTG